MVYRKPTHTHTGKYLHYEANHLIQIKCEKNFNDMDVVIPHTKGISEKFRWVGNL
jgi:hypothetical protein